MGKFIEYLPAKSNRNTAFTNAQSLSEGSFDVSKYKDFIPVIVVSTNTSANDDSKQKETVNQNLPLDADGAFYFSGKNLNMEILESLMKNPFNLDRLEKVIKYDGRKKTRIIVKSGTANIAMRLSDVVMIFTKDKLVYVVSKESKKYTIDKTLTQLEEELDSFVFFRANRQTIVNLNFIKSFKPLQKVKLLLEMEVNGADEPIVISQQVAPDFKRWIEGA
ncbi:MAG: LytR/AlgR family response regulator transcription factor [Ginsengibacter sp.]